VVKRHACVAVVAGLATALGCTPSFSERPSVVTDYRVLAVQSEPAEWQRVLDPDTNEAKPATYRALVTNPLGTVSDASLEWTFCTLPKPLTELNDVNIACFQNDPSFTVPVGQGAAVSAAVPESACRNFGPDVPENQAFRPADPDVTGGYYQPLRVLYRPTPEALVPTFAKVRIRCGLAGASQEQVASYNRGYHLNTNPRIASIAAGDRVLTTLEADPAAAPLVMAPGERVVLRVTWPACPLVDACGDGVCGPTETKEAGDGQCEADCKVERACGGAERFLAFRLETRQLTEQREVMRVSWFTTAGGGSVADDRTGRDATDPLTFTENEYTAPSQPGLYPVWAVLRDSRGGLTWGSVRVRVP
jgi:hypothetical protein